MISLGVGGYAIQTRRRAPPTPVVPRERVRPTVGEIVALAAPRAPAFVARPKLDNPIPESARKPTLRFVRIASEASGISFADIMGPGRTAPVAYARQIAFFLCRRLTTRSLPSIGYDIGRRDHTTALHGIRKMERKITTIGEPAEDTPEAWARHLWGCR